MSHRNKCMLKNGLTTIYVYVNKQGVYHILIFPYKLSQTSSLDCLKNIIKLYIVIIIYKMETSYVFVINTKSRLRDLLNK